MPLRDLPNKRGTESEQLLMARGIKPTLPLEEKQSLAPAVVQSGSGFLHAALHDVVGKAAGRTMEKEAGTRL